MSKYGFVKGDFVEPLPAVAVRIREARESKGLTQAALAARLGTTRSQVTIWETGGRNPSPSSLKDLAQALDVNVEWLSKGTGPVRPSSATRGMVDPELLNLVMTLTSAAFKERGLDTSSLRFTQVVSIVYTACAVIWAATEVGESTQFQDHIKSTIALALGA